MSSVILKPEKERSAHRRHPWIFSGAIERTPTFSDGEILAVHSSTGELLGSAYFHTKNSLAGRFLSYGTENPLDAVRRLLKEAIDFRQNLDACRLINAEGDGLPGLIVDKYRDVLVIQIHTYGMERLKNLILEELILLLSPKAIYEKSLSAARKLEGLADNEDILFGDLTPEVTITENGIDYIVSIEDGQKTGFFLDQSEMRKKVMELSAGRRVLNCFAYTGGFSLAALKGGAVHVDSVDICPRACDLARRNNTDEARHSIFEADAFEFLKNSPMDYDLVILDPPAFAKKRADVTSACQGYKEINRRVLEKIPACSLLLTSSCSSYIDDSLFQNLIFQASLEAKRSVRIVGRHILAMDHPISIYHPEGDYLKSLLLYIT